jgi:hypothetical protein
MRGKYKSFEVLGLVADWDKICTWALANIWRRFELCKHLF